MSTRVRVINPIGVPVPVAVVSGGGGSTVIEDGGGSITVDDGGVPLTVGGLLAVSNFPATQAVSGTVLVGNFPASQPVTDGGGSLTVDGTVGVSNFPAVQAVSDNGGSLTVDGTVAVSNLPVQDTVVFGGSYDSGILSGAASADASTSGRFWLVNHIGSSVVLRLDRVVMQSVAIAAASVATAFTLERITFTGAPVGLQGVVAPFDTAQSQSGFSVRTASTGMVIASGAVLCSHLMAQSDSQTTSVSFEHINGHSFILRPGEGLVFRQATAGDTDQRVTAIMHFHAV